ncbi:putative leucine-rich repeat domain superfamily, F-box-like domain superfamily [Helianthus debilis subsp. tardiflorus]
MKTRSMYKAERMSLDKLPEPVLETILCLLPTEKAARTSILSREWRYKWTNIPSLRFTLCNRTSEPTSTRKTIDMNDLHQVLLLRQGPIHELTLVMDDYWKDYNYFEFRQIILHLSRNHPVKKLTLFGPYGSKNIWHKLPKSVFALHHLRDLWLSTFHIDLPSIFNGFGCLGSLCLIYVKISTQTLLHLLSNCPSLKTLNLWLVLDSVAQELPTSLIHLKSLCLNQSCLSGAYGSALLLALIKCSPNLEHAYLEMNCDFDFSAIKDEYSDVWLEHLNKLEIYFFRNSLETEFVKFMFARSPKPKKVSIFVAVDRTQDQSKMLETLFRTPRASSAVKITIWTV